eukprot:1002862-Amphidinium_carterae.1
MKGESGRCVQCPPGWYSDGSSGCQALVQRWTVLKHYCTLPPKSVLPCMALLPQSSSECASF